MNQEFSFRVALLFIIFHIPIYAQVWHFGCLCVPYYMFGIDEAIHGHVRQITQPTTQPTRKTQPALAGSSLHLNSVRFISTQVAAKQNYERPRATEKYKYLHFIQGPAACYY